MSSIAYLSVDEKALRECWEEIREDFWEHVRQQQKRTLRRLLESSLEVEMTKFVGSERCEQNAARRTYRNGYYARGFQTGFGYLDALRVPRAREGAITFQAFSRYQQRRSDVDEMIKKIFLNGVSTRKVKDVLEPLLGSHAVSATTVSNITKALDRDVMKFHNRSLNDTVVYLILDGIYLRAKSPVKAKRRCILVAYGIYEDGRRELLDFQLAKHGESEAAWSQFLGHLAYRGLEGKKLQLVAMDGNPACENAVGMVYPQAKIQRCWAHKLRNVANYCPRRFQDTVISDARKIYQAKNKAEALWIFKKWRETYKDVVPKAVACLERDIEDLLQFYAVSPAYWKKVRTTNAIERAFREVRRRTRPMSCFQNRESVERIVYAIFHSLNTKWRELPLAHSKKITHKV